MPIEDTDSEDDAHGDSLIPTGDELIDDDMPCIRCSYNLRGLKPIGQCPECGAKIERTIAFLSRRVLCPTCMQPNHPSNALCVKCRNPLTGSAATADYWRPKSMAMGTRVKRVDDEEDEPESPSTDFVLLCWFFGGGVLVALGFVAASIWSDPGQPFQSFTMILIGHIIDTIMLLAVAIAPLLLIIFPTRSYFRRRREYLKKHAEYTARESAKDAAYAERQTSEQDP